MIRALRDIAVGLWVYATTPDPPVRLPANRELREPAGIRPGQVTISQGLKRAAPLVTPPSPPTGVMQPPSKSDAPCVTCARLSDCLAHHDSACADLRTWRASTDAR